MKRVSGTLNGTGAAIYVGLGFVPDSVKVFNNESTTAVFGEWNRDMRTVEATGGNLVAAAVTRATVGAGIRLYRGGDLTVSGNSAYLISFADVYGKKDVRAAYSATAPITKWTLGNSGNRTGNFDHEASTSYVGEGSEISIYNPLTKISYNVFVQAMTSNGEAANEVTLSEAVPSGDVQFLGPMYDYVAAPAGVIMPAGFVIDSTTLSVSGQMISFVAESWL